MGTSIPPVGFLLEGDTQTATRALATRSVPRTSAWTTQTISEAISSSSHIQTGANLAT